MAAFNPHNNSASLQDGVGVKPTKSYRNQEFLGSRAARTIRIMCEYEETEQRLKRNGVNGTVLVFGSARGKSRASWDKEKREAEAKLDQASTDEERQACTQRLDRLTKTEWLCDCMEDIRVLSRRVTQWCVDNLAASIQDSDDVGKAVSSSGTTEAVATAVNKANPHVVICTGGGPGFMEAANHGAWEASPSSSIGMGISLPFEPSLNPYVTPDLAFEYHYFFTRKFWMVYYCLSLVVAPGGFGTLDELFEVITLRQTRKIKHKFPIVLFGPAKFWQSIINWQALVDFGTISQSDIDQLTFTNSVDEAFELITGYLFEIAKEELFPLLR